MPDATTSTTINWHQIEKWVLLALLVWFGIHEYQANKDAVSRMQQTISVLEKDQAAIADDLKAKIASLEAEKSAAKTPTQQAAIINHYIPLPTPIQVEVQPSPIPGQLPKELPDAPLPKVDVKPLADYVTACEECKANLKAAQEDNKKLKQERDEAVTTAKGGGFWRRTRHDLKVIGITVGVALAATCGSGHCK